MMNALMIKKIGALCAAAALLTFYVQLNIVTWSTDTETKIIDINLSIAQKVEQMNEEVQSVEIDDIMCRRDEG